MFPILPDRSAERKHRGTPVTPLLPLRPTVRRYLRFLEISYQVVLLRPLLPTVAARLVKSPKLYWTDPGLARVLGNGGLTDGALFETAVLAELVRWRSWQQNPPALHFHRTHAGREIDFVLYDATRLLVMEAKASERAHRTDARAVADVLSARVRGMPDGGQRLGLVVTRGREIEPLTPGVWAIPDWPSLDRPARAAATPERAEPGGSARDVDGQNTC